MSKTETWERNKRTKDALDIIHGIGHSVEGAWAYVYSNRHKKSTLSKSKFTKTFSATPPFLSSLKGGVVSKRKYQALINSGTLQLIPYRKVVKSVSELEQPAKLPFPTIQGQYTDLACHLKFIIEYYIGLNDDEMYGYKIDWLGEKNHIQLAFGGDGAQRSWLNCMLMIQSVCTAKAYKVTSRQAKCTESLHIGMILIG